MRAEDVKPGRWYEAKVPIRAPRRDKEQYQRVLAIGVGDSYADGDAQMVAVVYKAPLTPRGTGIALVSPRRMRLVRQRPVKNEGVDPPEQP